jgi:hypothetical protein
MIKAWAWLRGKKRHAGAIVFATLGILRLCGVEIDPELERTIAMVGTLIFGVGWIDKGKRALTKD